MIGFMSMMSGDELQAGGTRDAVADVQGSRVVNTKTLMLLLIFSTSDPYVDKIRIFAR